MKEKFRKAVESKFGIGADKFCNSVWYIIAYGITGIISHSCDIPVFGAAVLTVLFASALIFCKNSFTTLPFFMMCSFVLSVDTKPNTGYFNTPLRITVLCFLLAVLLAAVVFHLLYYGKWRLIFKKAYLTSSMAMLTGALLIGGLGAPLFSPMGVVMSLAVGACMFLPYSLLVNCGEYRGRKTVEYFAWAAIVAAAVIFAAVIEQYIIHDLNLDYHPKKLLEFGHTISNSAAVIVLMAMPMTFYMVYVYKYGVVFLIALAMQLVTIFLTYSRASLIIAVGGTVVVAVALMFKKKNGRLLYCITAGILAVAVLIVAIRYRGYIWDKIVGLFEGDFTGSGRTNIWKAGFNAWRDHPIFGVGLWYLPQIQAPKHMYHSYHCTPLTYLYCAGIVGLVAYIFHRYKTVRMFFGAGPTAERVFIALSVIALLLNSLLDIYMTEPLHLLYYSVMLALIECDVKKSKSTNVSVTATESNASGQVKNGITLSDVGNDIITEGDDNELQS